MANIRYDGSVKELRIVSLGKTGVGKSHTGNTILCNPCAFHKKSSPTSETQSCESVTATVNGRTIKYIDTPGFFDNHAHVSQDWLRSEIMRSIVKCAPGPHAFLILLKVERYTAQEVEIVKKITETFGEDALNYAVVLFTHGDALEGQTIEEFVRKNPVLKKLVDKCGGRCHVIDNKYWNNQLHGYTSNKVQIESLMNTIDKMSEVRYERCYTNEMLHEVQRNLNNEMQVIRAESYSRWSEKQIRKEAEERVHTKLTVRLVGIATGALLGAWLGVKHLMCFVVKKMSNNPQLVAAAAAFPGINIAADAVVVGAALVGAVTGAQTAYYAVEGEQTIGGAIRKAYQACTNEENERNTHGWKFTNY